MKKLTKPSCEASSQPQQGEAQCESTVIQKDVTEGSVSHAISPTVSLHNGREQLKTETSSSKFGNESCSQKPDCYKCVYRGGIPGDAHSCCKHPAFAGDHDDPLSNIMSMFASVNRIKPFQTERAGCKVTGNKHGIKSGWFNHPFNFDPCWLVSCEGFKEES